MINVDNQKVASLPKKRASRERCTTPSKIITRIAKRWSTGSHLQQYSEKSAAKPPVMGDAIKEMNKEAQYTRKDVLRSQGTDSRSSQVSSFDKCVSGSPPSS